MDCIDMTQDAVQLKSGEWVAFLMDDGGNRFIERDGKSYYFKRSRIDNSIRVFERVGDVVISLRVGCQHSLCDLARLGFV